MKSFRRKIYSIIEKGESDSLFSRSYDVFMLVVILISLLPLTTHTVNRWLVGMDILACLVFIVDYFLRWLTADFHMKKKGPWAFLLYPFTPMAIIDLLSILPTLSLISPAFKVLRMSRLVKILRLFKFFRYYEPLQIMVAVIRRQGKTLLTVLVFVIFYVLVCGLIMFNVEHDPSFATFFDAVYWACCTLTTVGYGDIHPVGDLGRAFSMLSSLVGIALIALPSGIVTSGYMDELRRRREITELEDE